MENLESRGILHFHFLALESHRIFARTTKQEMPRMNDHLTLF